jgi:hypothetical protein
MSESPKQQGPRRIPVRIKTKSAWGVKGVGSQSYRDAHLLQGLGVVALPKADGAGERWIPLSDLEWLEPIE